MLEIFKKFPILHILYANNAVNSTVALEAYIIINMLRI